MKNLDQALSELCEKLGIHSDEFMQWLTNEGLQSYANTRIVESIVATLLMIGIIAGAIFAFNWSKKLGERSGWVEDTIFIQVTAIIVLVAACFIAADYISDLISWWLYPDGMILNLILNKL